MTLFEDLEEWKAIQQALPLIYLSAQHVKSQLSRSTRGSAYCNAVDDFCQEIQMVNISSPQGSFLSETTIQECKLELTKLLQLFESLVDEKLLSKCWVSGTDEPVPPSPLWESLHIDFPKLSKLSGYKADHVSSYSLFPTDASTTDTLTIQNAVETITDVNKFLISIAPAPLRSFAAPLATKTTIDVNDSIRSFTENILDKLHALFSECKYGVTHQMMVQIPELNKLNKKIPLAALNLLLSSCMRRDSNTAFWQEASCSYLSNTNYDDRDCMFNVVKDLCCIIQQSLHLSEHLQLHLLNEELVSTDNTDNLSLEDNITPGHTLYDLITAGHFQRMTWKSEDKFTIWEKRALALNIGLLFMYLYDCKWTKSGWEATNMYFLASLEKHQRENLLQVPPYLGCGPHLASSTQGLNHPYFKGPSDFLSFGKLLVELEFGEEVTATQQDKLGTPSLYITLLIMLEQGRISANRYYTEAIRGCLQLYKNPGQPESVRTRIYSKIVSNLEKEMACLEKPSLPRALTPQIHEKAHLSADIEPYDIISSPNCSPSHVTASSPCDLERPEPSVFYPTISMRYKIEGPTQESPGKYLEGRQLCHQQNLRRSSRLGKISATRKGSRDVNYSPMPPYATKSKISKARETRPSASKVSPGNFASSILKNDLPQDFEVGNGGHINLFDGSDDCLDASQKKSSEEFFASYEVFKTSILRQHVPPDNDSPQGKAKISICVIDTGVDKSHPSIRGGVRRGSIRECRSWIGAQGDVRDECGHGTHVVQLILGASDNVDVYVAKISDSRIIDRNNIGRIAEAINHAVSEWNVDIITMSFGFPGIDLNIEKAINDARACGKLLFAAAANHGNNGARPYPANNGNVICISASDGKGKDGRISPAAEEHDENFMTLGIAIPLVWKGAKIYKSGTSYATPVAVGFAVNILELVRSSFGQEEFERLKHDQYLMRRMFMLMSKRDNGYAFVAPWLLWGSKETQLVNGLIRNTLYS